MSLLDAISTTLLLASLFYFTAGTVGLVRCPDLPSRLHALTKADNLGLGLAVLAVMAQADSWAVLLKLALIWGLVLASGSTISFLIAGRAYRHNIALRERPPQ